MAVATPSKRAIEVDLYETPAKIRQPHSLQCVARPPTQEELASIAPDFARNIKAVLVGEEELQRRVRELAAEISRDLVGEEVIVVGLLNGAFMALADIARRLTVPTRIDTIALGTYGDGTESSGVVRVTKDLGNDIAGKHVIIVEDLIDTGVTLQWIQNYLATKDPKSVKLCCILDKPARRGTGVKVDYVGFTCPDEFVVGYGMDFAQGYRSLPFVGVLREEAYKTLG